MKRLIKSFPWWAKIGGKLVLSRVPAGYSLWQRLGLFRHGYMDTNAYALGVFQSHMARAGFSDHLNGSTVLELGPGDSVATAVIANAYGARAILVDTGNFASSELEPYRALSKALSSEGFSAPDLDECRSLPEVLEQCHASYLTKGLVSLRELPTASVDFVFSQAVLEHVRKNEFLPTQEELYRVLIPGGVCSHRIDLRDHLGGGLNNLRFSERIWESKFFVNSGFYTNRIGFSPMIDMFQQAGFNIDLGETRRWDNIPLDRSKVANECQDRSDNDLRVSGFDVQLCKLPDSIR